jgi:hypothetical protein
MFAKEQRKIEKKIYLFFLKRKKKISCTLTHRESDDRKVHSQTNSSFKEDKAEVEEEKEDDGEDDSEEEEGDTGGVGYAGGQSAVHSGYPNDEESATHRGEHTPSSEWEGKAGREAEKGTERETGVGTGTDTGTEAQNVQAGTHTPPTATYCAGHLSGVVHACRIAAHGIAQCPLLCKRQCEQIKSGERNSITSNRARGNI